MVRYVRGSYSGMSFLVLYGIINTEQAAQLADHMPRGLKCSI